MHQDVDTDYDAIVVGAGFAGVALIHYLREAGLSLQVYDRASDIWRNLGLEPLSRGRNRQRGILLLPRFFKRGAAGMDVVKALPRQSGNAILSPFCC